MQRSDGDWQITKSPLHEVYMWSVLFSAINSNPDTVATVQSVQSVQYVHNLTLLQRSMKHCQYFHDLRMNNTSSQGHKKADQFNKMLFSNIHAMGDSPRAGKPGKPL